RWSAAGKGAHPTRGRATAWRKNRIRRKQEGAKNSCVFRQNSKLNGPEGNGATLSTGTISPLPLKEGVAKVLRDPILKLRCSMCYSHTCASRFKLGPLATFCDTL